MTIYNLLPLYKDKKIHIDTIAFLMGTNRRGAQQMVYKARKNLYKKRPPEIVKENYDKFVETIIAIEQPEIVDNE